MKKLRCFFNSITYYYYHMKTMQRFLFFYVFTFFIPLTFFLGFYYTQFNANIVRKNQNNWQNIVESITYSYQEKMNNTSRLPTLFFQNYTFRTYLENEYATAGDRVNTYNYSIFPTIDEIVTSNDFIADIRVFSMMNLPTPPYYFFNQWGEELLPLSELASIYPGERMWQFSVDSTGKPQIICYAPIYNINYSIRLAYILFYLDPAIFLSSFSPELENTQILFHTEQNWYLYNGSYHLSPLRPDSPYVKKVMQNQTNTHQVNFKTISFITPIVVKDMNLTVYLLSEAEYLVGEDIFHLLLPIFISLFLITSLFFLNYSLGTRRITGLANHLIQVDIQNPKPFPADIHRDEIGSLIDSYNIMVENMNRLVNNVYRAELKSRDARYYALQAQINPHFLLNTLENIRMMSMIHGDEDTAQMIFKLGKMMHYIIRNDDLSSSIGQEAAYCENYLELCSMRSGKLFHFKIFCPEELKKYPCPKFILQPIAENAVTHAFEGQTGPQLIQIDCSPVDENTASIHVSDNGKGMEQQQMEKMNLVFDGILDKHVLAPAKHGVGLLNVNERLKIYYGPQYGLHVTRNQFGGCTFHMTLALKNPD